MSRSPHRRLRVGAFPREDLSHTTILIAEDDEFVLSTVISACKLVGYQVIAARDGREAWKLFESQRANVSLALLDQCMPFLSGSEVAQRIRMIEPLLPLIMITADRHFEPTQNGNDEFASIKFLRKPQDIEALLSTIAAALDY